MKERARAEVCVKMRKAQTAKSQEHRGKRRLTVRARTGFIPRARCCLGASISDFYTSRRRWHYNEIDPQNLPGKPDLLPCKLRLHPPQPSRLAIVSEFCGPRALDPPSAILQVPPLYSGGDQGPER